MQTEWVTIPGWDNYLVARDGRIKNKKRDKLVSQFKNSSGKLRVNLWKGNKQTQVYVHRVLALAFIPNPNGYELVRHLDDIGDNNAIDNLAWGTAADNAADMLRNGNHYGKNKVSCKHGHEYTEHNTYVDSVGGRRCRECARIRSRNTRK